MLLQYEMTMDEYNEQLAQLRREIAEELETIRCLKAYRLILTEELNRLIDNLRCLQIRDLIRRIP